MAILPGHDETIADGTFSASQMRLFAVFQLIELILCLAVLYWLLHNAWVILYRQKKFNVLPLSTFYVLAFMIVVLRIYDAIWNFESDLHPEVFTFLMPMTLEFLLGTDMCWIVTELCLRINFVNMVNANSLETNERVSYITPSLRSPVTIIKYGRIVVTIIIAIFVLTSSTIFIVADLTRTSEERKAFN